MLNWGRVMSSTIQTNSEWSSKNQYRRERYRKFKTFYWSVVKIKKKSGNTNEFVQLSNNSRKCLCRCVDDVHKRDKNQNSRLAIINILFLLKRVGITMIYQYLETRTHKLNLSYFKA